jgi:hypothetical protein
MECLPSYGRMVLLSQKELCLWCSGTHCCFRNRLLTWRRRTLVSDLVSSLVVFIDQLVFNHVSLFSRIVRYGSAVLRAWGKISSKSCRLNPAVLWSWGEVFLGSSQPGPSLCFSGWRALFELFFQCSAWLGKDGICGKLPWLTLPRLLLTWCWVLILVHRIKDEQLWPLVIIWTSYTVTLATPWLFWKGVTASLCQTWTIIVTSCKYLRMTFSGLGSSYRPRIRPLKIFVLRRNSPHRSWKLLDWLWKLQRRVASFWGLNATRLWTKPFARGGSWWGGPA